MDIRKIAVPRDGIGAVDWKKAWATGPAALRTGITVVAVAVVGEA
jgi:hypothetical protein